MVPRSSNQRMGRISIMCLGEGEATIADLLDIPKGLV